MSNNLKYAASLEDLPPGDDECAICQERVYVGRNPENVVDCIICSTCGNRVHKSCNTKREFKDMTNCPSCRGKNTMQFCFNPNKGYKYVERRGGKRRKTKRRKTKRRKTKRRM
jgi:hypothetical protein